MSFESDLFTLLKLDCPRVFPDFAPVDTVRPYVTFQAVGGDVVNYLDPSIPNARHAEMQINVWSNTRAEALSISRAIENRIRSAVAFVARPVSAQVSDYDADVPVYGCRQDFSIWFAS
jgi:hypothetical protein